MKSKPKHYVGSYVLQANHQANPTNHRESPHMGSAHGIRRLASSRRNIGSHRNNQNIQMANNNANLLREQTKDQDILIYQLAKVMGRTTIKSVHKTRHSSQVILSTQDQKTISPGWSQNTIPNYSSSTNHHSYDGSNNNPGKKDLRTKKPNKLV